MTMDAIEEIKVQMRDPRAATRVRALGRIADKKAGGVELKLNHPDVMPILLDALSDTDRRVQRAAARALRPLVRQDSGLLDTVLPYYAAHAFDGSFTHAGLLDVRNSTIWVPRFAAAKGHAALLADGNTDRFFKFEFFMPNQSPRRLVGEGDVDSAHLLLHFILDWSYSRQSLIPEQDDRGMKANRRQQQRHASAVVNFYGSCGLARDIAVHRLLMQTGRPNAYELNVDRVPGKKP